MSASSRIFLSYPLSESTPAYGGAKETIKIKSTHCICDGASNNSGRWSFPNHSGTHIDAPRHFDDTGKTVSDYPASFWFFDKVSLVDLSLVSGRWITWDDVKDQIAEDAEIALIKTGFCDRRNDDVYWSANPGISEALGHSLRQHCPNLRMIGFDFISVSRWEDRMGGRLAHHALLDTVGEGSPILPIEDMDLTAVGPNNVPDRLIVAPMVVQDADGGPATVIAEFHG